MKTIIQIIEDYGIPTSSHIRAGLSLVRDEYNQPVNDLTKEQYEERLSLLTNETLTFLDHRIAKYTYLYFIQEFVRQYNSSSPMSSLDVFYNEVHKKAIDYINDNPHHWAVLESDEVKLDENGNPKKKKGEKKELARQIWLDNPDSDKKEIIKLLVSQASLTERGALTYYYNLKKEFG